MKVETEFIEEMIRKYGSRKALISLAGMAVIMTLETPEMLEPTMAAYLAAAKIAGITILGAMAVLAQWNLDKQNGQTK